MKKLLFVQLMLCLSIRVLGQADVGQDWDGFSQKFDVANYQGGQFRLKAYLRVKSPNKYSNGRLWARVDTKHGIGYFNNMQDRPVVTNEWKEYVIEGPIDPAAQKLIIGGLYFGAGKYYYDNFSLELKKSGGEFEKVPVANEGFENDTFETDWKTIYQIGGFQSKLTTDSVFSGKHALLIDASERRGAGKFVPANGISIYFEMSGKGDTVILLHGNSESSRSFEKQIPEFSKYFTVIALDSRGQGYTTKDDTRITYDLMAEDVNAFMERLGIHQARILGWSDGGNIGLILAMKHPDKVKQLAVMGANLFNDDTSVRPKTNKTLRSHRAMLVEQNREENKFNIEMIDLLLNEPKINPDDLVKITCPTLVLAGSKDVIKTNHTQLIAAKIPNSKLIIFEKGTHYEPVRNPEGFNEAVLNFFRGLDH